MRDQKHEGRFALIDTPGPNEAGQTLLKHVMKEQLEQASAVIVVLDYTQMNAEAEIDIRQSLHEIAQVTRNRLYVFVNKFDQKDRNGLNVEALRSYVAVQLFEGLIQKERVYPVSSKQAYLANRALGELHVRGELADYRFSPWVEDFGQLALGTDWESEINDVNEVKERANKLWKNSLFDEPLTAVIRKGSENAALVSLRSAVAKILDYDKKIIDNLQLRCQALNTDVQVIENHIKSLQQDISAIRVVRSELTLLIDKTIKKLEEQLFRMFDESEKLLEKEMQIVFDQHKSGGWLAKRLKTYGISTSPEIESIIFNPDDYIDFMTEEEARGFFRRPCRGSEECF